MKDLTYQIIRNGLDASAKRQRVISSNIANVNTPGYKASTVKFETELQKAIEKKGTLTTTHEKHLGGADASKVIGTIEKISGSSMNENGNNVDIDREMVDLAANEIYYNVLIEQLNRKLSGMSYVINR